MAEVNPMDYATEDEFHAAETAARRAAYATPATVEQTLRDLIEANEATMAEILEVKPAAASGRSDGRRVRYVKAETTAAVLRTVLELLEGEATR